MSTVKNPIEKKRLSYERDHYNWAGEHNKSWRRAKPRKKAKARRAYRKLANDLARVCITDDSAPAATVRRMEGLRQRSVHDYGSIYLRAYVEAQVARRKASVDAKKKRRARAGAQ